MCYNANDIHFLSPNIDTNQSYTYALWQQNQLTVSMHDTSRYAFKKQRAQPAEHRYFSFYSLLSTKQDYKTSQISLVYLTWHTVSSCGDCDIALVAPTHSLCIPACNSVMQ